jgi:hypothetical protein
MDILETSVVGRAALHGEPGPLKSKLMDCYCSLDSLHRSIDGCDGEFKRWGKWVKTRDGQLSDCAACLDLRYHTSLDRCFFYFVYAVLFISMAGMLCTIVYCAYWYPEPPSSTVALCFGTLVGTMMLNMMALALDLANGRLFAFAREYMHPIWILGVSIGQIIGIAGCLTYLDDRSALGCQFRPPSVLGLVGLAAVVSFLTTASSARMWRRIQARLDRDERRGVI